MFRFYLFHSLPITVDKFFAPQSKQTVQIIVYLFSKTQNVTVTGLTLTLLVNPSVYILKHIEIKKLCLEMLSVVNK